MAPDCVNHILQLRSREEYKQFYAQWFKGHPDARATLEDIVAEGDLVCLRSTNTGTHTGEYQGLAPTGKKYKSRSMEFLRVVNGKIVEVWTIIDWCSCLEFFQQIGIVDYKGYPEEGVF